MCVKTHGKDWQKAQYIKVPATKSDNLSSISVSHIWKERINSCKMSSDFHMYYGIQDY